jgi:hypothetical protein
VLLSGCATNKTDEINTKVTADDKAVEVNQEVIDSDKRMLLSSLYLTKCTLSLDDFSKLAESFNSDSVQDIGNGSYLDQTSGAVVTLQKDMCAVQMPGKDLPKLASSLDRILTVGGGNLSIAFVNGHYNGTYTKNGATFNIAVKQHFQEFYYMSVILRRVQE